MRKLKYHEKKLLKKVDFLEWKREHSHRELQVCFCSCPTHFGFLPGFLPGTCWPQYFALSSLGGKICLPFFVAIAALGVRGEALGF
jgi:hypothetical protein